MRLLLALVSAFEATLARHLPTSVEARPTSPCAGRFQSLRSLTRIRGRAWPRPRTKVRSVGRRSRRALHPTLPPSRRRRPRRPRPLRLRPLRLPSRPRLPATGTLTRLGRVLRVPASARRFVRLASGSAVSPRRTRRSARSSSPPAR
jgi:hypothetical protein